jgi:hypothetical protein
MRNLPKLWADRVFLGDHDESLAPEKAIAAEEPLPMSPAEIIKAFRDVEE